MAANGQKLRVAVTKTSAQGKSAQSATPNLMSFSTDENSIWFNGKKYGIQKFGSEFTSLNSNSNSETIKAALGDFTQGVWDNISNGILCLLFTDYNVRFGLISNISQGNSIKEIQISTIDSSYTELKSYIVTYDGSTYSIMVSTNTLTTIRDINGKLDASSVINALTSTDTTKVLSAAMGKKLQDEKLAKTDVVNNLTSTDTTKALSAAQGKKLNDAIDNIKIKIFESLSGREGDNVADVLGKFTDDWNVHPEKYIFYIKDDSEMCIAPCTVYYEANMRYLSYQVNGTIYEYDCEYDENDICNLMGIYTFHATPK